MNKKVLTEIEIYSGEVNMPKHWEINRDQLKSFILDSFIKDKRFFNNAVNYTVNDYEVQSSPAYFSLDTYIRENMMLKHKNQIFQKFKFGSIYETNMSSPSRKLIDPLDLRNSPDYTFIYAVDVEKYSFEIIIEYDDNRRANKFESIMLKNNEYVMFPSTLNYFITKNKSSKINTLLTIAYDKV